MEKRTICNRKITPRLFSNPLLETLSHVHPAIPLVIYLPVIAYCVFYALTVASLSPGLVAVLFLGGLACWTFVEYALHRFVFHYEPSTEFGQKIHFLFHGIHHAYPRDPKRLVMPPSVSIPLAAGFYGLFVVALGQALAVPFFAGFMIGYLCYDGIHYAVHHFSFRRSKLFTWLKQHHLRHHYQNPERAYGVSSPLWDHLLGTMPNSGGILCNR
jgi:sterol desaturase/sphingolipid hydroxylase (fatty acid hydroxylase superfamily)